jgi:predicted O-methyltransferase YrrM
LANLDSIYACHPLRAATILGRLARSGESPATLTEWQLAIDPETELTDQNHSGGVQAVLELAVAAGVTQASTVVDIGAGLGGSSRVLAAAFGCRVIGIEQDAARCRDAVLLTERAKLDALVTVRQGDALSDVIDLHDVDVLWGQGAWIHFPSPEDFLGRWLPALGATGRVAMADAFLARPPVDRVEETLVAALEAAWGAHLVPLDRWRKAMEAVGCRIVHMRDATARAATDLATLRSASIRWPEGTVTAVERESWELAAAAFGRGLVSSWHLVGKRD